MASRKGSQPRGAKKRGGGGRFTWGRAGDLVELEPLARQDPLYDPELDGDENYTLEDNRGRTATRVAERLGIDTQQHRTGFAEASVGASGSTAFERRNISGYNASEHTMTLSEFKRRVSEALTEFLSEGELANLYQSLVELGMPFFRYEIVKRAITISLDRGDREREMISQMLNEFYGILFTMEQIGTSKDCNMSRSGYCALPRVHSFSVASR